MHYKRELQQCYNDEATKFSQTRQKHWHEFDHILEKINTIPKSTIHILELGCGDGRLYDYIHKNTTKKIQYTGIDFSKELLKIAKKKHPEATRVCDDMINGIKTIAQESCDVVVSIAAFQHLPSRRERVFILKGAYRALVYDGLHIMVNRAYSDRFYKKYRPQMIVSICKYILSWWYKARNDILIPRKGAKRIYHRYYHIFTLKEIEKLVTQNGFYIDQLSYGLPQASNNLSSARNSLCIARKAIHD